MFGVTLITLISGTVAIRNGQNHFRNNALGRNSITVRFGAQTKIGNFCYVAKIEKPLDKLMKAINTRNIFFFKNMPIIVCSNDDRG